MLYKPRYSRPWLHAKKLALVVRITRIVENERHLVQFSEDYLPTSLGIRGEARLAEHPR
jgi:hypothetical protein